MALPLRPWAKVSSSLAILHSLCLIVNADAPRSAHGHLPLIDAPILHPGPSGDGTRAGWIFLGSLKLIPLRFLMI